MGSAPGLVNGSSSSSTLKEQPEKFCPSLDFAIAARRHKVCNGFKLSDLDLAANCQICHLKQGLLHFFTALPAAIAGHFSAKHQGNAATAGMQILAKRPEDM